MVPNGKREHTESWDQQGLLGKTKQAEARLQGTREEEEEEEEEAGFLTSLN